MGWRNPSVPTRVFFWSFIGAPCHSICNDRSGAHLGAETNPKPNHPQGSHLHPIPLNFKAPSWLNTTNSAKIVGCSCGIFSRWRFQTCFEFFTLNLENMISFCLAHIFFSNGLVHPPTIYSAKTGFGAFWDFDIFNSMWGILRLGLPVLWNWLKSGVRPEKWIGVAIHVV